MKVTRANEYWGVPDETPRRTAAPLSQAEIDDLLRGPRIHGGLLRWAEEDKPKSAAEVDDPSKTPRTVDEVVPHLQRLEQDLGNEGGSSASDGTPENWPIIMPGDKLMNAAEDVADTAVDVAMKKVPTKESAKKAGRRYATIKDLWLRTAAAPDPNELQATGEYNASTHGAMVHADPTGQRWLVKPPRFNEHWPAPLDVATAKIQQRAGLTTPEIHQVDIGGVPTAVHKMFPATDAFPGKQFGPRQHNELSPEDIMTLQKHHVLDWMMANHDSHPGQFIRHKGTGELVGIDKGQAFKLFGKDKMSTNYHPNEVYDEEEPIYNTMWRNFAQGRGHMNDPRFGELGQFIQQVQAIPDEEYHQMLRPFAEKAVEVGKLATGNVDSFLAAASARKNNLHNDFANFYEKALAQRQNALNRVGRRTR